MLLMKEDVGDARLVSSLLKLHPLPCLLRRRSFMILEEGPAFEVQSRVFHDELLIKHS